MHLQEFKDRLEKQYVSWELFVERYDFNNKGYVDVYDHISFEKLFKVAVITAFPLVKQPEPYWFWEDVAHEYNTRNPITRPFRDLQVGDVVKHNTWKKDSLITIKQIYRDRILGCTPFGTSEWYYIIEGFNKDSINDYWELVLPTQPTKETPIKKYDTVTEFFRSSNEDKQKDIYERIKRRRADNIEGQPIVSRQGDRVLLANGKTYDIEKGLYV